MIDELEKNQDKYPTLMKIYNFAKQNYFGLENLTVMATISIMAGKTLAVIGISGTGKSTVTNIMSKVYRDQVVVIGAITINGLMKIKNKLTNTDKVILVDDLSVGATDYAQIMTLMSIADLVYTHMITKYTQHLDLEIRGFYGSAIINLQPLLYRKILLAPEFDTDIRDKTLRYFHIVYPKQTNTIPPQALNDLPRLRTNPHRGVDIETSHPYYKKIVENLRHEHSKARAEEHTQGLLRGIALVENRDQAIDSDYKIIYHLTKNFRLETEIAEKKDLEGLRRMDINIIPILTMINTFKKVKIDELCKIFQVKKKTIYDILANLIDYVILVQQKGIIIPTEYTLRLLREIT
jgi:ABC-type oligopeptide transport system ATPase subunit